MTNTFPTTSKYSLPLLLSLIVAGLVGNYLKVPLFLNIDFLFGSIFALLTLQFFGLGRGILASAMIASYTYVLWNHPYAIIIMTAEVAIVGWLMERRRIGMVVADTLYWVLIGMPLVYLFYHGIMHASVSNAYMTMIKQAVNGIANALIARLIFSYYAHKSRSSLTPYRDITYNLMAFFVLCPALVMLVANSRIDFDETDRSIRSELLQTRRQWTRILETWVDNRKLPILNLAELAASRSPQTMQPYIEQARKSDVNYLRIGLTDKEAVSIAFSPLVDEKGLSTIGISFAERPYVPILQQTLKPMLSEVIKGKVGTIMPRALMLAPVIIGGKYDGYVFGVLDFSQLQNLLVENLEQKEMLYTLVDKNNNVIMSNRSDQKMMEPYVRHGGTLNRLDAEMSQWMPALTPNITISERWKQSFYVAEYTVDNLAEWKMIIEQPVAPYQIKLYHNYANKLSLLFLVLLGALAMAELLSRRFILTIETLGLITKDLPIRVINREEEITWPESGMTETNYLIRNFREMTTWLKSQFDENRQINESLEHRVAERTAELLKSEQRYRSIFNASPVPMACNDDQQRITFLNPAFVDTFGYSLEDIPTLAHWWPLAYPDPTYRQMMADTWQANFEASKQTGTAFSPLEAIVTCKDLTKKTVLINAASIFEKFEGDHLLVLYDITERKKINEELQASLAEKEVLLREVHHRVKNNMAAIIGLLELQRQAVHDPLSQAAMTDLSARIRSMSLVHEKLYRSETLSKVDFQEYLQALISHLRTSFGSPHIRCDIEAQGIEMPLDLAVPCGMIINELIINALKYAFPQERSSLDAKEERILVALSHDQGTFTLSVSDNGVGLPPGFDLNTTTSLGLSLIYMLGEHQLGGRYEIDQLGGTRFTLTFALQDGGKPYA